jgi:predicted PurR-regulated permease PerM
MTEESTPQMRIPPGGGQRIMAILAVAVLAWGGIVTVGLFVPALGWAAIFAVALWPPYSRLIARWPRHARGLLPAAATGLVTLFFIVPLVMIATAVLHDSANVMLWVRDAQANGIPTPAFLHAIPLGDHVASWWTDNLSQPGGLAEVVRHGRGGRGLSLDTGEKLIIGTLHRALLVVFMLLILFFMLRDGERLARALHTATRRAFGSAGERVGEQVVQAVRGTVNGLVVVGFGEGLLLGVSYAMAGVTHAALLALLTALLSAIPMGAVVAYLLAAGIAAAGGDYGWAIGIAVWGSVVVFVADHFVRPVLIGGATRLPFILVLIGILGGIEAWHLIGLVLGPALMAALMLLWREWVGEEEGPLNPHPVALPPPPPAD